MSDSRAEWPKLSPTALHGLAGDVCRTIEPHTEADIAGLLFTYLTGFGCLAGPATYYILGAQFIHPRLQTLLIGDSGFARKGTAQAEIEAVLKKAEGDFFPTHKVDSLASGPALARFVHQLEMLAAANQTPDKRVWVVEEEFVNVLRAPTGTNSISAVLRKVYDTGSINNITKRSPISIKDAHVCITGHTTLEEFEQATPRVDRVNGFVNRFLLVGVKMSKVLDSSQTGISEHILNNLAKRTTEALAFAHQGNLLTMTSSARYEFDDFRKQHIHTYQGQIGEFAAAVRRADQHVLRMAILFAILDLSQDIEVTHIAAAIEAWNYCEQTARYVFSVPNPNSDRDALIGALLMAGPNGLDTTERKGLFSNNMARLRRAEKQAEQEGQLVLRTVPQPVGRPRIVGWHPDFLPEGI